MNRGYYMDIKIVNHIPQNDINFIINMFEYGLVPYDLELIGSGYSASVYRYKNYAIKAYEDEGFMDGQILENFQDNDLFLKLYFYSEEFMVTEYLDIIPAYQYYDKDININFNAKDIFEYCLHKGYKVADIHDENVVVTKDGKFKIIDVGTFRKACNNVSLQNIINSSQYDYNELQHIINHVKIPPIAI
jgi:hypothetical protein